LRSIPGDDQLFQTRISSGVLRSANREFDAAIEKIFIQELRIVFSRFVFIGAIAGIAFAHCVVLYKIDTGIRSSDVKPITASRSHIAFW
jgi:hypothetical protein